MSLSIIVCVTSPAMAAAVRENVGATIGEGVEYEIIEIPNVENPRPLVQVYNQGASMAKYPNLLFLHQDAGFESRDWWKEIAPKLSEPDCGVIGFAGTKVMFDVPSGWGFHGHEWVVINLKEKSKVIKVGASGNSGFHEVVAVDGFAMFVRKDVWEKHPFDDVNIKGFHCYDIDFSLCVGEEYKNYVCSSVLPYHLSMGNFNVNWVSDTLAMYEKKWHRMLPRVASDVAINKAEYGYYAERAWFRIVKFLYKRGVIDKRYNAYANRFSLTARSLEHRIKLLYYKLSNRKNQA